MKNYWREIIVGLFSGAIFIGLSIWFLLSEPDAILTIIIAFVAIILGIFVFVRDIIKRRKLEEGKLVEDEFTQMARTYAGNQAFRYSMYLWFFIFIFRWRFTEIETMLGIGILGSALIYGVWLWYYNSKGGFDEE